MKIANFFKKDVYTKPSQKGLWFGVFLFRHTIGGFNKRSLRQLKTFLIYLQVFLLVSRKKLLQIYNLKI